MLWIVAALLIAAFILAANQRPPSGGQKAANVRMVPKMMPAGTAPQAPRR